MSTARLFVWAACLAAVGACAGVKQQAGGQDAAVTGAGGGAGGNAGGTTGAAGTGTATGTGGGGAGTTGAGGACSSSVVCNPPGGLYCGKIGTGCPGQQLDCGTCPGGFMCSFGLCVGDSTCVAGTCGSACGTIGDGCGHAITCGACGPGLNCSGGLCISPSCVPGTCNGAGNAHFCGTIGDGCGGALDCGTCPNGGTCGATTPGVCNDPTCVKATCTPMGGQYCGTIGDGCGGTLNCGACTNGMACPTTGTSAGVCPGSTGTGTGTPTCTGATKTTISGTVYDPAGVNPLYNIIVYVPSGTPAPIQEGVTCDKCGSDVNAPLASALTDVNGHFSMVLEPVPSTTNVPLVMQIGKWRRQITIPTLQTCKDNPLTDKNQTRLPRTSAEGHIPRIAVTTGSADALECLPRRIGIADSEFGTDGSAARIHLYAGGGGTNSFSAGGNFAAATALWSDRSKLANYDAVILSCEGSTSKYVSMKPQTSVDNVQNYADSGGRLFASHLHFYWLQNSMSFNSTAAYIGNLNAPGASASSPVDLTINQTFPKGLALAQWLAGPVVAASTTQGTITVAGSEHSVTGVNPPTTEWIYLAHNPNDAQMRRSEQYLSFNTPVGTPEMNQCGKVVFTDIHIKQSVSTISGAGGDDSDPSKPFPTGCKTNMMTPQAKALEFLFFDLTSCVEPPNNMPQPPIVPPPGVPTTPPPTVGKPPAVPPPPPPPPPPNPG